MIGVAPDGFQHVGGDFRSPLQGETVDIWLPIQLDQSEMALRQFHFSNAVARIRDGFTAAQARADLEQLAAGYERRYPNGGPFGIRMEPLLNEVTGRSRDVIWLLVAAGGLVLLVAFGNIAGLSVARAVARRRELTLRRALGANGWHLVRVGLSENVIIGVAGAALGLVLASLGLPLLRHLLPSDFPRAHDRPHRAQRRIRRWHRAPDRRGGRPPGLDAPRHRAGTPARQRRARFTAPAHRTGRRGGRPGGIALRRHVVPVAKLPADRRARPRVSGHRRADVPAVGSRRRSCQGR